MINISFQVLKALEAVYRVGSFQNAAKELRITQSAVTQRIHQLENQVGSMVITRSNPPSLTKSGEHLMRFTKQLVSLEQELIHTLNEKEVSNETISIALNYDSMSSWFMPVFTRIVRKKKLLVRCVLRHEEKTIESLRKGEAQIAITTNPKPIIGGEVKPLGSLKYVCIGTKRLKKAFDAAPSPQKFFESTPTVFFSIDDYVCSEYYRKFSVDFEKLPYHVIPSNYGLYSMIKNGVCYGLVPEPQVKRDIANGYLVSLTPKTSITVDYYLHYWRLGTSTYKEVVTSILSSS